MSSKIFDAKWEELDPELKKKYLSQKLLGLNLLALVYGQSEKEPSFFHHLVLTFGLEVRYFSNDNSLTDTLSKNKARTLFILTDESISPEDTDVLREKIHSIDADVPLMKKAKDLNQENGDILEFLRGQGESRAQSIKDDYEMMKNFTDDVANIIDEVEESCLKLENNPNDEEALSHIFGLIHTVKGASGFFEPRTLHLFAHSFEDQLKKIQSGSLELTSEVISVWLKALDIIGELNREFSLGEHENHDVDMLVKMFVSNEGKGKDFKNNDKEKDNTEILASINKSEDKKERPSELKISMHLLDEFTQTSGELTVIRNMINKVVRSIEKQYRGDKDVVILSELLDEMHKINSDVQNKISDIRRVGISNLIKPLARNIRDTSRALNKEVDFIVEGEEVRLDNSIADLLSRCLVHLMRNSLDHGIELPEERKRLGKASKGKLILKFESKNEAVYVTIKDDGRGIDPDKIRQKVISQGLRTPEKASEMSSDELNYMIFESGFSTAQVTTEFSGRGVGMSMVKETIEEVKGKISIKSEKGFGSEFLLEIPVPKSVLITSCLFISSGNMIFGMPQENIVKVIEENIGSKIIIEALEGGEFLRFENRLIPIITLSRVLNIPESKNKKIMILESENKLFALRIDEVFDIEDAVIKQLAPGCLKALKFFQGGTFLGDGTVGLVFDVPGLVDFLDLKNNIKQASPLDVTNHNFKVSSNIMVFELDERGVYALRESDIYRVEFIDKSKLQKSGQFQMMPYRDSILTLIDVQEVIFGKKMSHEENSMTVLITKNDSTYLGLIVKNIIDLVDVEMNIIPSIKKISGIEGLLLFDNKTYTIISLEELIKLLSMSNDQVINTIEFKCA